MSDDFMYCLPVRDDIGCAYTAPFKTNENETQNGVIITLQALRVITALLFSRYT